MLNTDHLEKLLGKYAPVSAGFVQGRLSVMDVVGQLIYSNDQIIVVYLLSTDPYSPPQKTGITQAKTLDELAKQLNHEFGLSQRGVDAKYGYFCLIPTHSITEAEEIIRWLNTRYPVLNPHKLE